GLVGDAEGSRHQGAAAGDAVAPEAGAVPGGPGQPVAGQVATLAGGALGVDVVEAVGVDRVAAGQLRHPAQGEGAVGLGPDADVARIRPLEDDADPVAAARAHL